LASFTPDDPDSFLKDGLGFDPLTITKEDAYAKSLGRFLGISDSVSSNEKFKETAKG